jgi:hypothetical protein
MEDEEQDVENENRAPPTPLNPERSGCSPEVVRTSSPLRRRELSGLKTTPIWMISTRWILVLQFIRFRNDPQVQFFLNEPFLANYPAILRIRATSGHALGILRDPNQPGGLQPPEPIRAPRTKNPPAGLRRLRSRRYPPTIRSTSFCWTIPCFSSAPNTTRRFSSSSTIRSSRVGKLLHTRISTPMIE